MMTSIPDTGPLSRDALNYVIHIQATWLAYRYQYD